MAGWQATHFPERMKKYPLISLNTLKNLFKTITFLKNPEEVITAENIFVSQPSGYSVQLGVIFLILLYRQVSITMLLTLFLGIENYERIIKKCINLIWDPCKM